MPERQLMLKAIVLFAAMGAIAPAQWAIGQIHSEDFDDGSAASRFSAPIFSSESGLPLDGLVDLALDYSGFGVAPAPNSAGTTIGLGIQVNNADDPVAEGIAIGVSPLIANLPGDYTVRVDANVLYVSGPGASEHAVLGVDSDRLSVPLSVVPAGTGQFYHFPHDSGLEAPAFADDYYRVADGTVVELYNDNPNDAIPHPETLNITFPESPPLSAPGFAGSQWVELELRKSGSTLTFLVNDVQVDQYNVGAGATSGDIMLGGADLFNSANDLNWILFDNLVVEASATPPLDADFDGDSDIDGQDFLIWQRNLGLGNGSGMNESGDANGDGNVDAADLSVWRSQFGGSPGAAAGFAIPEPGASLAITALVALAAVRDPRRARLASFERP